MKGYKVDVKRKKIKIVEDNEPFPDYPPHQEAKGIDLNKVAQFINNIDPEEVKKLIDFAKKKGWI